MLPTRRSIVRLASHYSQRFIGRWSERPPKVASLWIVKFGGATKSRRGWGCWMFRDALRRLGTVDEGLVHDVADGKRFVWLGSGISREQVPDLADIMCAMLLELRDRAKLAPEGHEHRAALMGILEAHLAEEIPRYLADPQSWKPVSTEALRRSYSDVVGTRVGQKPSEYLLLEVAKLVQTYGDPKLRPGPIHYYLGILIAEGMVKHLASGNWDGLVETAVLELTSTPQWLDVYVVADDRRSESGFAQLAKFHGCAVLARERPDVYESKIVATRAQISRFSSREEFKHMRNWLAERTERERSLILGLSVQDQDLLDVFTKAAEAHPWDWDRDTPAYVFAQPALGTDQLDVLENCYNGTFEMNLTEIRDRSAFGHYAGPLIAALTWRALNLKMQATLARAEVSIATCAELRQGIEQLGEEIPRRLGYSEERLLEFLTGPYSRLVRDYYGNRGFPGTYAVALRGNLSHVATDPSAVLLASDLFACAMGFVGWGFAAGCWELQLGRSAGDEARLRLVGGNDRAVGVRFVRSALEADEILQSSDWVHAEEARALLYMKDRPREPRRSSASRLGSGRRLANRAEASWNELVDQASSVEDVADRFMSVVGL